MQLAPIKAFCAGALFVHVALSRVGNRLIGWLGCATILVAEHGLCRVVRPVPRGVRHNLDEAVPPVLLHVDTFAHRVMRAVVVLRIAWHIVLASPFAFVG